MQLRVAFTVVELDSSTSGRSAEAVFTWAWRQIKKLGGDDGDTGERIVDAGRRRRWGVESVVSDEWRRR